MVSPSSLPRSRMSSARGASLSWRSFILWRLPKDGRWIGSLGRSTQGRANDELIVRRDDQSRIIALEKVPRLQLRHVGVDILVIPAQGLRQSPDGQARALRDMPKKLHPLRGKQGCQLRDGTQPDRSFR